MLLLTFCNISPRDLRFHPLHLILMSLQIVMSLGLYALTLPWHPAIAQGVCMAALTPTATAAAIQAVSGLTADDLVLFLLSGGGSALFERPLLPPEELADITKQLLACGADITEINTLRKRFSAVKGGKFAQLCAPAHVFSIVLSDILGDPLDMIASGPAYPDSTTSEQAQAIAKKYDLHLSDLARDLLTRETPKDLPNAESRITGSVRQLCAAYLKMSQI